MLTKDVQQRIEQYLRVKPAAALSTTLDNFICRSVHKSRKTIDTLRERLDPFIDYLARAGVDDALEISRQHIEGFLREIGQGRRGRPLTPSSLFGFAKDVRAFINFVGDTIAPDDWQSPVRRLPLKHPQ